MLAMLLFYADFRYYVTYKIINKIFVIILIAWRKRSILDLSVKSVGKIIYSTEYCGKI